MNFILSNVWKPLVNSKGTEPVPPIQEHGGSGEQRWPRQSCDLLPTPIASNAICSVRLAPLQVLTPILKLLWDCFMKAHSFHMQRPKYICTPTALCMQNVQMGKGKWSPGLARRQIINPGIPKSAHRSPVENQSFLELVMEVILDFRNCSLLLDCVRCKKNTFQNFTLFLFFIVPLENKHLKGRRISTSSTITKLDLFFMAFTKYGPQCP